MSTSNFERTAVRGTVSLVAVAMVLALVAAAVNLQRIRGNQRWLEDLNAQYSWASPYTSQGQDSTDRTAGMPLMSNIASVDIGGPELDDTRLNRIGSLKSVTQLRLSSSLASDKTLSRICQLDRLTQLALSGERFTFLGLLELRKLEHLRTLELRGMTLSDGELSVLKSALPEVKLSYNESSSSQSITRAQFRPMAVLDEEPIILGGLDAMDRNITAWSLYDEDVEAAL